MRRHAITTVLLAGAVALPALPAAASSDDALIEGLAPSSVVADARDERGQRAGGGVARHADEVRDDTRVHRLPLGADGDAVGHSLAISRERFGDDAAAWVVLGRDDVFADSLAATPLVALGPLLHTDSDRLDVRTAAEVDRVLPEGGTVYLLGGKRALSEDVAGELASAGYAVRRLAGADRVATSLVVADEVVAQYGDLGGVVLARAWGTPDDPNGTRAWADSVAGGGFAATYGLPVVVTRTGALDPEVDSWLDGFGPEVTVLLGGDAALSPAVEAAVPNPARIAGRDRAGTAAWLAATYTTPDEVDMHRQLVVNMDDRDGWVWGLAAAGMSSDLLAPILAGRPGDIPAPTAAYLDEAYLRAGWSDVFLLGGRDLVGDVFISTYDGRR